MMVVRAVLVLALGLGFLLADARNAMLGNLLAMFWLAGALLTLRWVRAHRDEPQSTKAAVAGALGVFAAVIGLTRSLIHGVMSVDATLTVLGVAAITIGVLRLMGGFRDDGAGHLTARRLALGVSEILIGILWIVMDDVDRTTRIAVGVWALIGGCVMLVDTLDLRRLREGPRSSS